MKPLPRGVKALGWTSFFTDFSTEMIYPLLPRFLSESLKAGPEVLGLIEGVAESTASLLKIISGYWSDHFRRRKPFVLWGYTISGVWPLLALAPTWPIVLLLRFVNRLGKGLRSSPRDALIADLVEPRDRGAAYGFNRAMDHAGAMVGPLVAAALMKWAGFSLRQVFLFALLPAVVVVFILLFIVEENKAPLTGESPGPADEVKKPTLTWAQTSGPFRTYLAALFLFTLGNSTDAFLLLKLSDAGVALVWLPVLWSLHHLVKSVSTYWGGGFSDKVGRRVMILAGWGVYALVYLAFSVVTSEAAVIAVFMAYGLYFGLAEPVEKAWVADLAPKNLRGSAFGWYHGVIGLGALPASLLFGWIWVTWSPSCAFVTGACLAGGAALLLLLVQEKAMERA